MKRITLILALCASIQLNGQQLISSIGRVSTEFDYLNSEGETLDNLFSVSDFSYSLGYRLTLAESLFLSGTVVYNKYNNEGSDLIYDNYYRWKTNYLGISISPEYQFLNYKKFKILARADFSPQFLLNGTQTINNQVFSLKGVEQFENPFLFLRGGIGTNYCLDDKVALSLNYFYGWGSPTSKSEDGESLKLKTSTFSIGLLWGIKGCKYCADKRH